MLTKKEQTTLSHLKSLGRFDDFYLIDAFGFEFGKTHKRFIIKYGMFNWLRSLENDQLDALLALSDDDRYLNPTLNPSRGMVIP